MSVRFSAVVLAGGGSRRLGGPDKLDLRLEGQSLLDRTLRAVADAEDVVVVGPQRSVSRDVVWTSEQPPGGGPLAGLSAGLAALPSLPDYVVVLAADHPYLTRDTVSRLVSTVDSDQALAGAVLTSADGRVQWLVGAWRPAALAGSIPDDPHGRPVREAMARLNPVLVPETGHESSDVDTPEDMRRLKISPPEP